MSESERDAPREGQAGEGKPVVQDEGEPNPALIYRAMKELKRRKDAKTAA